MPAGLRRAVIARDGGCAFPGCDRPAHWCDCHHIIYWADGGPTMLDNLILQCRFHHRLVHEGGWTIHRTPGGRPIFYRPDGTRHITGTPPGRTGPDNRAGPIARAGP